MSRSSLILRTCAVLFFVCACCTYDTATAQTDNRRTVAVTGSAEMQLTPDEITLAVSIEEYYEEEFENKKEKDYKTLVSLAQIEKDLLAKLRSLGIADTNIMLRDVGNTWQWYKDKMRRPTKLTKTFSVIVRDVATVDRILNSLDMKGVSNVWIEKLRHTREKEYRKQLKIEALRAAREKATYLVESLGNSLGTIVNITEINNENPGLPMYNFKSAVSNVAMSEDMSNGSGVESKKITLRYEMGAIFEIK
jgi:uncharacterized protein YggE